MLTLASLSATAIVDMKNANYSMTWYDFAAMAGAEGPERAAPGPWADLRTLGLARTYNSRSLHDGAFGFGWCSALETRLRFTPEGNAVLVHCGAGQEQRFLREDHDPGDVRRLAERIVEALREAESRDPHSLSVLLGGLTDAAWEAYRRKLEEKDGLRFAQARQLGLARNARDGERLHGRSLAGSAQLVREGDGWRYLAAGGGGAWFDREGRLQEIFASGGDAIRLEWSGQRVARATRNDGQGWMRFEWTADGRVASLVR